MLLRVKVENNQINDGRIKRCYFHFLIKLPNRNGVDKSNKEVKRRCTVLHNSNRISSNAKESLEFLNEQIQ